MIYLVVLQATPAMSVHERDQQKNISDYYLFLKKDPDHFLFFLFPAPVMPLASPCGNAQTWLISRGVKASSTDLPPSSHVITA